MGCQQGRVRHSEHPTQSINRRGGQLVRLTESDHQRVVPTTRHFVGRCPPVADHQSLISDVEPVSLTQDRVTRDLRAKGTRTRDTELGVRRHTLAIATGARHDQMIIRVGHTGEVVSQTVRELGPRTLKLLDASKILFFSHSNQLLISALSR